MRVIFVCLSDDGIVFSRDARESWASGGRWYQERFAERIHCTPSTGLCHCLYVCPTLLVRFMSVVCVLLRMMICHSLRTFRSIWGFGQWLSLRATMESHRFASLFFRLLLSAIIISSFVDSYITNNLQSTWAIIWFLCTYFLKCNTK